MTEEQFADDSWKDWKFDGESSGGSETKDMSWLDSSRGGALVPPPEYRGPKPRRVKSSPFIGRKSFSWYSKDRGQPCKQGETAESSGCVPTSGESSGGGNSKPDDVKDKIRDILKRRGMTTVAFAQKHSALPIWVGRELGVSESQARKLLKEVYAEGIEKKQESKPKSKPEAKTTNFAPDDEIRQEIGKPNDQMNGQVKQLSESQRERIKAFTGNAFKSINDSLRKGKMPPGKEGEIVKEMDEAFKKGIGKLNIPVNTYRGFELTEKGLDDFIDKAKIGGIVELSSFSSTSLDPAVALEFAGMSGEAGMVSVMTEISANNGIYCEPFTIAEEEEELLLNRGSKFRVHGIKKLKYKDMNGEIKEVVTVQMEQL